MDGLRITVEPLADIAAAAALWRELEPRADGSFFTSWLWVGTWLDATAIEPLLVTAHDGARPIAAGLFAGAARGRRLLHETGSAAWDRLTIEYNDLLVAHDAARDPRPDCLAALVGQATREIGLGGVDRRWLAAAARLSRAASRVVKRRSSAATAVERRA